MCAKFSFIKFPENRPEPQLQTDLSLPVSHTPDLFLVLARGGLVVLVDVEESVLVRLHEHEEVATHFIDDLENGNRNCSKIIGISSRL